MDQAIPNDVKEFIHRTIHSLAQLEVLLHLHRERSRISTAEEITSKLYLHPSMVEDLLVDVVEHGLARREDGGFRYAPPDEVVDGLINRLAVLYKERRVAVSTEIFAKPVDPARAFADAFRLRKRN